ncbi:MAG: MATE family efflux transporter [Saccharofermentanales bacterium]|jgi:putative MATE family efflux protein
MMRRKRLPRRRASSINFTEGPILKNVVRFASPLLLMNLIFQLYCVLDLIIVSNFCGTDAMAAVGATVYISQMISGLALGLATGCSVITAQAWGAGNYDRLYKTVHSGYATAFLVGTVLSAAGILLARPMLTFMGTPADVLADATSYLRVYLISILPVLVYNMGAGILRGVGDTRHPFLFMTIAVIFNLGLSFLFVGVFKWGIIGAAYAYVIAQFLSAVLVTASLMMSHEPFRLFLRDIGFHKDVLQPTIKLGVPAGLQSCVMSLSNVFVQSNINKFGKQAIAGLAAAGRLDGFVFVIINGLALTAMSFMSANIGAQKKERAKKGLIRIILFSIAVVFVHAVILLLFRYPLLRLFSDDHEVMRYASTAMFYVLIPYVLFAITEILGGTLRSAGQSVLPMVITIGMSGVRVVWILAVLPFFRTFDVLVMNYSVSWVFALIVYLVYFKRQGDRIFERQM